MHIKQMMPAKYLRKEDVGRDGTAVTIKSFKQENVAPEGKPEEHKYVMYFKEFENGLVLNTTNLQLAAMALNSEDTDDWIGKQIVVWDDPTVSFGGNLTGGIRIKAATSVKRAGPPGAKPDQSPQAWAQRMKVGISSDDSAGAAYDLSGQSEEFVAEVWALLPEADQEALTKAWPV